MDEISPLAIEGFALSMLAETLRQPVHPGRKPPRWLAQAREIIQAEFTNQLSLETIAKRVGVHPMHLPRLPPALPLHCWRIGAAASARIRVPLTLIVQPACH